MWAKLAVNILKPTVQGLTKIENKLIKISSKLSQKTVKTACQAEKTFEPIMPPELSTLKEMKQFNKSVFGIKVFDIQDKEFGKFLTDGMTNFYNKTGGQFGIPKNIIICDLPNTNGFMIYESTKDILAISKKHLDKFREIAIKNGETLEQILKRWGQTRFDGTITSMYEKGPFQELFHEFGHKAHSSVCKNYGNLGIDWTQKEFQDIAGKVSKYAKKSPEEFVAETFSLLVQGKSLPQDVIQLYKKCDAPIINNAKCNSNFGFRTILTDFVEQNGSTEINFTDLLTRQ